MSTRSLLFAVIPEGMPNAGLYRWISVHHDGYLDGVGAVLFEHYTDPVKINALFDLGDLHSIAASLDYLDGEGTVAHHRDDGEDFNTNEPMSLQEILTGEMGDKEWAYRWDGTQWHFRYLDDESPEQILTKWHIDEDLLWRLKISAPDMYEALKKAIADYGHEGGPWNIPSEAGTWISMARAAIAKAEGVSAKPPLVPEP